MNPALELSDLTVGYGRDAVEPVVRGLSLAVGAGEAYGIVGESGCGKSTTAMAIVRYLPDNGLVMGGEVRIDGEDVSSMDARRLRRLRGRQVAVVFQDPRRALNPTMRVGAQVREALEVSGRAHRGRAGAAALELLERVALAPADQVARRYPHQLSGGQQQRVVIAMAAAASPQLLVLDEPTSSLDATVEAGVLELLTGLRAEAGCAILFISHDLGLVARFCDRVGVLYAGRLVAEAPARTAFARPAHPYVLGLARSTPRADADGRPLSVRGIPGRVPAPGLIPAGCAFAPRCSLARPACDHEPPLRPLDADVSSRCWFAEEVIALPVDATPVPIGHRPADSEEAVTVSPEIAADVLLVVDGLTKRFGSVVACDAVSIEVGRGETFGLVGESGSGKSTLGRCIVGLEAPDAGRISLSGRSLRALAADRPTDIGRSLQMVFQHPDSTLNPWRTIGSAIERARLRLGGTRSVEELLAEVGLDPELRSRRPVRLSGGQRQRVAIARALAGSPQLVVCDEPLSALDVSVQASVLELLTDLQRRSGLSLVFISHDLAVVRSLAHRVGVMLGGQVLEVGRTADVLSPPHHPYTAALAAAADARPVDAALRDADPIDDVPGHGLCPFRERCPLRLAACSTTPAPRRDLGDGHHLRCHRELHDLVAAQIT